MTALAITKKRAENGLQLPSSSIKGGSGIIASLCSLFTSFRAGHWPTTSPHFRHVRITCAVYWRSSNGRAVSTRLRHWSSYRSPGCSQGFALDYPLRKVRSSIHRFCKIHSDETARLMAVSMKTQLDTRNLMVFFSFVCSDENMIRDEMKRIERDARSNSSGAAKRRSLQGSASDSDARGLGCGAETMKLLQGMVRKQRNCGCILQMSVYMLDLITPITRPYLYPF